MAVITKLIYRFFFFLFRSVEESVARQKGKGATVWIRPFIKQLNNALVHLQPPFGLCTRVCVCLCVSERERSI